MNRSTNPNPPAGPGPRSHSLPQRMSPLPRQAVTLCDPFWQKRRTVDRAVTLSAQYRMLVNTGRIENFRNAALRSGEFQGQRYNDSDVYKWVEAAASALQHEADPALQSMLDEVVKAICAAPEDDGYLNTYVTLILPTMRWRNLGMGHELYCAGHLFEAAIAHATATGSRELLDVAVRFADLLVHRFVDDETAIPGHPQIERALLALARHEQRDRYRVLARHFLERRGHRPSRFEAELNDPDTPGNMADYRMLFLRRGEYHGSYAQDHRPLLEQGEVVGHAVRAMYLYAAWAELAAAENDESAKEILEALFQNLTQQRMYLTGAIGSARANEGFTEDYDLPNATAYAETCAGVGLIFFAHAMACLNARAGYVDVLERALYNGVLAGASFGGEHFFYENPLASHGDHHRQAWFDCACCPPNYSRLLESLERYVAAMSEDSLAILLLVGAEYDVELERSGRLSLRVESELPFGNVVELTLRETSDARLLVRVPEWCEGDVRVENNGQSIQPSIDRGFLVLEGPWSSGDRVQIRFGMKLRWLEADARVESLRGKTAWQRGPLVYCVEDVDLEGSVADLFLDPVEPVELVELPDLAGGVTALRSIGHTPSDSTGTGSTSTLDPLYRPRKAADREISFQAVPYFAWDHRDAGAMRVWLPVAPRP